MKPDLRPYLSLARYKYTYFKMIVRNCHIIGLLLVVLNAVTCQNTQGGGTSRPYNPFNPFGGTRPDSSPFNTPLPPRDRDRDRERDRDRDRDFNQGGGSINPFNPFNPQRGVSAIGPGGFNNRLDFDSTFNFQTPEVKNCPPGWELYEVFCYRFVRSPIHNRDDARRNCQAYGNGADLLSINSLEEHTWVVRRLTAIDPQHREWYVSGRLAAGSWINADGSQLTNFDQAFLQDQPSYSSNLLYNHLAYSYSERRKAWGLLKVTGLDMLLYICEVPLAQVPYIDLTIDDRDFDYGLEVDDVRKIPKGPYFIQEPEDVVFDLSRNILRSYVSLSCLADGWPAPTYEWYKEEFLNNTMIEIHIDPLQNAKYTVSGGMLIIDRPKQIEDRGNYHCVATNQFGSVISQTASISFGYIGEFIPTRAQEIATQYWGKAIFCDPPQHYPEVLYYWSRKSFPNLVEEDGRVFVSYDGNLYISSVDMSDYGLYTCHVQSTVSGSGRTGPLFRLHVTSNANYQQLKFPNNFPKAFPEAPKAGNEVRLECVAFGYPVPTYNWTRKIGSIPKGAILSNYNRVLTLPSVKVEDQGEYVCRATNNRLSIEDSVTLSIQAAPNFTIPLGNRHMDKDDDLVWICEAFGIPDVEYQWYRDSKLLTMETLPPEDVGRYLIQDNVLTIRELNEENDAGMYQCRANNSLSATFSTGQLRVLYMRPSFKKTPVLSETLAAEGGNVSIKCQPEAAPRPTFIWKKDGNIIGSGGRRRVFPDGTLVIHPVSTDDLGVFTCVAQNVLGVEESSGWLEVLQGPVIVDRPPDNDNYTTGTVLSLQCRAEADPALDIAYVWRRNGFRLDDDEYMYRVLMDPRTGYLEINNVTIDDRGEYECEVNTWVGSLSARTLIHIMGPPGPSGGVQAYDLSSTTAIIRWSDGAMNGAVQFLYTIEGRTQWDPVWRKLLENVEADRFVDLRLGEQTRKEKLVGVLSPWSAYEFRVLAANRYGYGIASPPSPQYNTLPDRPFIAPRNVGGGGGKTGSLTITWDPLPAKDQNAPGIYYKVFWRETRNYTEGEYQSVMLKQWGNIGIHVVTIPTVNFYILYDVKVQAWNDLGSGPESAPVQIYSAEDMPQAAPALVTPRPYNSTAINVTWIPVEQTREKIRGKLIGYRIRYWLKKDVNLYDPEALNYLSRSTEPWALILGLQPNTYYYVQAMAYNSAGPGPASEPQYDRTMKKAPQIPPISVAITMVDPTSIKVTWRFVATTPDEEALLGYKVRIWPADQDIITAKDHYVNFAHKRLEAIITGLQPAKKYLVRVLGYSKGGDGKMSSPAQEIILGDPQALRSSACSTIPQLITMTFSLLIVLYAAGKSTI